MTLFSLVMKLNPQHGLTGHKPNLSRTLLILWCWRPIGRTWLNESWSGWGKKGCESSGWILRLSKCQPWIMNRFNHYGYDTFVRAERTAWIRIWAYNTGWSLQRDTLPELRTMNAWAINQFLTSTIQRRDIKKPQQQEIEAPCSKLQGIFDPQGILIDLIARWPRSKLRGMRSLLDSRNHRTTPHYT